MSLLFHHRGEHWDVDPLVIYTSLHLSALSIMWTFAAAYKAAGCDTTTLFQAGLLIVLFSEVEAGQVLWERGTMLIWGSHRKALLTLTLYFYISGIKLRCRPDENFSLTHAGPADSLQNRTFLFIRPVWEAADPIPELQCGLTVGPDQTDGALNPSLCLLLGCESHSSLDCWSSVLLLSYQLSNSASVGDSLAFSFPHSCCCLHVSMCVVCYVILEQIFYCTISHINIIV